MCTSHSASGNALTVISCPGRRMNQTKRAYADALVREMRSVKEKYSNYRVDTVCPGAAAPLPSWRGMRPPGFFHALSEDFDISPDAEITMEVNPGTVSAEKAETWKACGVNRLSIGLQSADDGELKMLGRIHTFGQFLETWEIIRRAGFDNVNIDLISALPGQTAESWGEDASHRGRSLARNISQPTA